jgi:hypothetical protein
MFDGYLMVIRGQKFMLTASLIRVNEPLISAWLAIMVAIVANAMLGIRNWCGTISKNGLTPVKFLPGACANTQAPCPDS